MLSHTTTGLLLIGFLLAGTVSADPAPATAANSGAAAALSSASSHVSGPACAGPYSQEHPNVPERCTKDAAPACVACHAGPAQAETK